MIFQRILMMTLFCIIYSKPYERNVTEIVPQKNDIDVQKQKILSELKDKILTKLNISDTQLPRRRFNWDEIPDSMKTLFNEGVQVERENYENEEEKIETIMSPLFQIHPCGHSQTANQECFKTAIPKLLIKEITSAKLIAQLKTDVKTAFQNVVQYNITVNDYDQVYDVVVANKDGGNVEIDMLEVFKDIMFDDNEQYKRYNETTLIVTINSPVRGRPISEILDVTQMGFEVQYKPPRVIKRAKRSGANMCKQNEYFCCTQSMKINIEELQWSNFIVAPREFTINYCKGDCNNYVQYSSNHAKALNFFRHTGSDQRKDTRSCCIPYSFTPLTIMYESADNSLHVTTFDDLVASSCGCM